MREWGKACNRTSFESGGWSAEPLSTVLARAGHTVRSRWPSNCGAGPSFLGGATGREPVSRAVRQRGPSAFAWPCRSPNPLTSEAHRSVLSPAQQGGLPATAFLVVRRRTWSSSVRLSRGSYPSAGRRVITRATFAGLAPPAPSGGSEAPGPARINKQISSAPAKNAAPIPGCGALTLLLRARRAHRVADRPYRPVSPAQRQKT